MEITAAVVKEKGGAFQLEQMELDAPRHNEVLVRIVATGMCHTDMAVRDQIFSSPLPIALGHEGAGVVEQVGENVTKLRPGDHVVLTFGFCGKCANCQQGLPAYCYHFFELNFGGCRLDGSHSHHAGETDYNDNFFSQSSFGTYALSPENNVIKVDAEVPLELLGPLGCGIQTGAGAVMNALRPGAGSSIIIFGTGAVGLSAVMAAVVMGCTTIIAVDINDTRLNFAKELGVTHTINSLNQSVTETVRELLPHGVDCAFDTTGRSDVINTAVLCLVSNGTCGIVGASARPLDLDANYIVSRGLRIKGIVEGESVPDVFIPKLISLYKQGRFPFDKLIKIYPFEQINQAAQDSEKGITVKPVIRISE